jgi:hypothetical protein
MKCFVTVMDGLFVSESEGIKKVAGCKFAVPMKTINTE